MAAPKFYLRTSGENCTIQIIFQVSRTLRMRTATGLKINSNDWSETKGLPKQNNPENKNLATDLKELAMHLQTEYNADFVNGVVFSNDWLKQKISGFFNRIDVKTDDSVFINYLQNFIDFKRETSSYTDCTLRKYVNLKDRFTQFEKKRKKNFIIQDISSKTLIDFKNFLISECDMLETTATRFIKNLKTAIFDARNNGKQIHHQITGFSTGTTNTNHKVFLSFAEIEKIKKVQSINKEWNIARDWLILGCYLGQRASDLLRMTNRMIYTKTDNTGFSFRFVEITQQKTGEKVVIPLHDEVEKILKKYHGNFPPTFTDKADTNLTLFNKHLKKVCELAGIHDLTKGKVYNVDKKKNEILEIEKCYLVSSHVCRRSFATNFYGNKKFTTPELMAITGHKTESMFLNYIGKTSDDWAIQTAKTFKEIEIQNKAKTS